MVFISQMFIVLIILSIFRYLVTALAICIFTYKLLLIKYSGRIGRSENTPDPLRVSNEYLVGISIIAI